MSDGRASPGSTVPHLPQAEAAETPTLAPQPTVVQTTYAFLAPAQAPDEIGRLGPYRVLRVLGRGGMGIVFEADDPHLQRRVALKVMLPHVAEEPTNRERFLREARAAAALDHENVVPVFQVGEDRGVPFLAMPLLQGETLADRLKREAPLPVADVLRIGREAALGLAAAHAAGIVHRDVKPGNLWLEGAPGGPFRRVRVLDFGLARRPAGEAITQSGAIIGTPAYMAPEQARGKAIDARADLFSLGCVLYHMATGAPPFGDGDLYAVLGAVFHDTPEPANAKTPAVPRALSQLIDDLLAKDPVQRPQSAAILAEQLGLPSHFDDTAQSSSAGKIDRSSAFSSPPPKLVSALPTYRPRHWTDIVSPWALTLFALGGGLFSLQYAQRWGLLFTRLNPSALFLPASWLLLIGMFFTIWKRGSGSARLLLASAMTVGVPILLMTGLRWTGMLAVAVGFPILMGIYLLVRNLFSRSTVAAWVSITVGVLLAVLAALGCFIRLRE